MDITYLGNSCFKLKGKDAIVVSDPYDKTSADIVTLSTESNAFKLVSGTPRRPEPYVINAPGEYEVNGVGIFGWGNFKEVKEDSTIVRNTIYSIIVDGVRIVHTGSMKQVLSDSMAEDLGTVDVLLVGIGNESLWGAKEAAQVVEKLSPSIVVPMHYEEAQVTEFLKLMGAGELAPLDKLKVTKDNLPEGTQTVLLKLD